MATLTVAHSTTKQVPYRRMPSVRVLMAVTLAPLLVLAGLASAGQVALATSGSAPGQPSARPVLAAQQSTPAVASPVTGTADCDLSDDIPVLPGTDTPPFPDRTALTLNDGELSLRCGDSDPALIEQGVERAIPLSWPGALLLITEDDTLLGINLVTGARGDFGTEAVLYGPAGDGSGGSITAPLPYAGGPISRWTLLPATPEQTDWRIVDLDTMESLLLSDEIGGVLPRSLVARAYVFSGDAVVVGFPGTPVFGDTPPSNPFDPGGATPPPGSTNAELPYENAALVIDGSLDNRRWTEASHRAMTSAAISPDGELLAVEQMLEASLTIRVERLSDGELVAETGIAYSEADTMLLLNDGLLHLAEDRLDLVTWDDAIATETLLEFEPVQGVRELVPTTDPDIVVVSLPPETSPGWIVNSTSGEVTQIPHLLQVPLVVVGYANDEPVRHVLAAAPSGPDGQRSTIQLIDVATGEVKAESDPLDMPPAEAAMLESALRHQGAIGFVFLEDGTTIALDARTEEATTIEPPGGETGPGWFLQPSPTGDLLSAWSQQARAVFLMEVPTGEWREVPADPNVSIAPGSGEDAID